MAACKPGPLCVTDRAPIDRGTSALILVPTPAAPARGSPDASHSAFESAVRALEAELANAGAHLSLDAAARQAYVRQIRSMADALRQRAEAGAISWNEAALQANEARNAVMNILRGRSTPIGRAWAERIKAEGRTLNELIARKARQLFGAEARFGKLALAEQNRVYAAVVEAAGRSNPAISAAMRRLSFAGRGLVFVSVALSVYNVATAEDKVDAAERELTVTGASIAGGIAGGALAGLACGPGAPVCVTVGAFVGGALAAFGVDLAW